MFIFIYSIVIVLCIIGAVTKSTNIILKFVVLAIIAYLMGRGAVTYDTQNYLNNYLLSPYLSLKDTYEPGYLILTKTANYLNLSYIDFRIFTSFIALLLMSKLIKKLILDNYFYFYLFYCTFHIFIDNEQFRSFLAFSIVFYGLNYLLFLKKIRSIVVYILFILLASTIHISALLYLPLLLVRLDNRKRIAYLAALISVTGCIAIYFGFININNIKIILFSLTDNDDRTASYGESLVNYGFLYPMSLTLLSLIFLYFINKKVSKERLGYTISGVNEDFILYIKNIIDFVFMINVISIIYFPLYMFNLQLSRIARSVFLINIIVFSLLFIKYRYTKRYKAKVFIMVLILLVGWHYYSFMMPELFDEIVTPFFENKNVISYYG